MALAAQWRHEAARAAHHDAARASSAAREVCADELEAALFRAEPGDRS